MGDIKLWGRLNSCNVQKVVWTLGELELPYSHEDRGGRFGGLDNPEYLRMNPNGLVPTLRDGDLTLWEGHAIVRYLAARYSDSSLFPLDPVERAIVDQWTDWTATTFQPAWIGLFWNAYRTRPEKQRPDVIAASLREAQNEFNILDQRLAASPFLGGERLTYADIVAGVSLYRWFSMEIERPSLPAVEDWYARLRTRPAFAGAVMVPYEDLRWTI